MAKTYNKIFNYSGNKQWFISLFNDICMKHFGTNPDIVIDSFAGSGAISFNNTAKVTYLNEYNIWIYAMLMYSYTGTFYKTYYKFVRYVENNFGDIKTDKEAYYKFRNWWNETYYTRYKNIVAIPFTRDFEDAIAGLICLTNSCLNSMLRFGPNGMNQSFGRRHYVPDTETISNICFKDIKFTNADFFSDYYQSVLKEVSKVYEGQKIAVFLDPPYEFREMTYNNGFSTFRFVNIIKSKDFMPNSLIVYTDIENKISDQLLNYGYEKIIIREMKSTSPNRKNENKTGNEVAYIRKV